MLSKAILWYIVVVVLFLGGCTTPLYRAAESGDNAMIEALTVREGKDINEKSNNGKTALHGACKNGKIDTVKLLISKGADVNSQTNNGWAPLANAAINGHLNVATLLIGKGAKVNIQDRLGNTPLHWASLRNSWAPSTINADIAKLLINNGANIDAQEITGQTPLHKAAWSGDAEIAKLLIDKGANLDLRTKNGVTALDATAHKNNYVVADLIRSAMAKSTSSPRTDGIAPERPSPSNPLPVPFPPPSKLISTGTGWVTEGGYIFTNQHVIEGYTRIAVRFNGASEKECLAEVVVADENNDPAVLKINSQNGIKPKGLPIAAKLPRIGAAVFTIGYPKSDVMGLNPKVTNGIVSALSGIKDDPRVIQTTVAIQSGNSGGPLLNMKGEVVGITTASLRTRMTKRGIDVPQGVNYAVKSGYASALLASVPEKAYPMEQSALAVLEELIPKVQDSIVQVIVTSNGNSE